MATKPMTLAEEYDQKFATSKKLYEEAGRVFPSGFTHDARRLSPFPVYMRKAEGSKKWDVDGNEIIDYVMGHGALLLGHKYPAVMAAAEEQLKEGTHFGAPQEHEIEWGRMVMQLIPSAERVKFTSSGTEATMMALRLARAYTGKSKIIKFMGHFHGWHDYATVAVSAPFNIPTSAGIPKETQSTVYYAPPGDIEAVKAFIAKGDVAGVILEPHGASMGTEPTKPGFLEQLRKVTAESGVVLIFDEVVTGFRCSNGGVQKAWGVTPDLTTLAKILGGGFPGGAVAGKYDIMQLLEFRSDPPDWNRGRRIAHPGTFNANPLSAAAGAACLKAIADGKANEAADKIAAELRNGMNEILAKRKAPGCVYGDFSFFHVLVAPGAPSLEQVYKYSGEEAATKLLGGMGAFGNEMKKAFLLHGLDLLGAIGIVSAVHTEQDVEVTLRAFDQIIARFQKEGAL